MAQTISVSLKTSMIEDFKRYRLRFNISEICQKAIEERIEVEKLKDALLEQETSEIIAKLAKGKLIMKQQSLKSAIRLGSREANAFIQHGRIEYADFLELEQLWECRDELMRADKWVDLGSFPESIQDELLLSIKDLDLKGDAERAFLAAFVESALDAWETLSKELEAVA
jgi:hypothetical protein